MPIKINMHLHTKVSDGGCTVEEVLHIMKDHGFSIVSITDHDRLEANRSAIRIAKTMGLDYITGVEITVDAEGLIDGIPKDHFIHLLGYGFDLKTFEKLFQNYSQHKIESVRKLHTQLVADGYKLRPIAPDEFVTRTEIAELLVESNYSSTIDEAFDTILDTKYASFKTALIDAETAIKHVHDAGGIVVWAHPRDIVHRKNKTKIGFDRICSTLERLIRMGLDGIEARYVKYDELTVRMLEQIAAEFDLCITAGSDFHGGKEKEYTRLKSSVLDLDLRLIESNRLIKYSAFSK